MLKRGKRWRLVSVVAAFAIVITACDSGSSETTVAPETTLSGGIAEASVRTVRGALSEPLAIDPQLVSEPEGFEVARLLFDSLTRYDPDGGAVVPGVAQTWEADEDNTVWTFHLRRGVTFSDGSPLTAHDFVYAFNRLADPDLGSLAEYLGGSRGARILGWEEVSFSEGTGVVGDQRVEGITAVDDLTFEITTESPMAFVPKILAHPAFSPVKADHVATAGWADMPVGNGPYRMAEAWQHGVSITMERNDRYYGSEGSPDRVEFHVFSDPAAEFQALLDGEIDVLAVGVEQLAQARARYPNLSETYQGSLYRFIGFPTQNPPYDSAEMRRALIMSVDRETVAESILDVPVANGFVPPVTSGSIDGLDGCPGCAYDPVAAKELFNDLGGIPGNKVTLAFVAAEGHERVMDQIAADWKTNLGLDVEFLAFDWAAYLEFLGLTGGPKPTEPFLLSWSWDYPSSHSFLAPMYSTDSSDNFAAYSNADFDDLIEAAERAPTEGGAIPFLEEAQRILGQDVPVMPLTYGVVRYAWNSTVTNVSYDGFGFFRWESMVANT